jgi:hypothetical protein
LLNQAGVALPPKNWDEFQKIIPQITKFDATTKKISLAGAAIGASNKNIDRAADLLYALMLQTGTKMTTEDFSEAAFASKEGESALNFYAGFANPKNSYYTWNSEMPNSLEAISGGQTVMIFNYGSALQTIRSRNPLIDLNAVSLPGPKNATQNISYPNYWGLAVSKQSKNQSLAWDIIIAIAGDKNNARIFMERSRKSPALLELIAETSADPNLAVFAKQALTARSWPKTNSRAVDQIFSEMIEAINGGAKTNEALKQAEKRVTELMKGRN